MATTDGDDGSLLNPYEHGRGGTGWRRRWGLVRRRTVLALAVVVSLALVGTSVIPSCSVQNRPVPVVPGR
jgi:hypothetical protein